MLNVNRSIITQLRLARTSFWLTVLSGVAGGLLLIFQAHLLASVITRVFLQRAVLASTLPSIFLLILVIIIRAGLGYGMDIFSNRTAVAVKTNLRSMLLEKFFSSPFALQKKDQTGVRVTVFMQDVEALDSLFSQYLPQLFLAVVIPLGMMIAIFPLDVLSGIILFITAPLIPLFMMLIGRTVEFLTRRQWNTLRRMSGLFLDTLQGLTTLKLLNQSRAQQNRIQNASDRHRQATLAVLQLTFVSALVLEMTGTLSTALIAVQIGLRLLYQQLDFQSALFILILAPEFYAPLRMLGQRFHAGQSGLTAARSIFSILGEDALSSRKEVALPGTVEDSPAPLPAESFQLTVDQVQFAYPGEKTLTLEEVSFTLCAQQQVALVGMSGAGKSTIARLLLRFIEPTAGTISLDKSNISTFDLQAWRSWITWIPQKPYLFHDSLLANIRFGKSESEEREIMRAIAFAHIDEFIAELPSGLDTVLGERGSRLSSGQAQRVALARAYLKGSPFIVMDEPSSHLDLYQEKLLSEVLAGFRKDRTIFIIAHRLSTIINSDLIYVLDGGRIVEQGTHQFLSMSGKLYPRFLSNVEAME